MSSSPSLEPQAAFYQQLGNFPMVAQGSPYTSDLEYDESSEQIVIAYTKYNSTTGGDTQPTGIYVRYQAEPTGTVWNYYGSDTEPLGCFNSCTDIDLAKRGSQIVLAWIDEIFEVETSLSRPVYVRYWNGGAWVDYTSEPLNSNDAYQVEVEIGSDGIPVVSWYETNGDGGYLLYVRKLSGSAWVPFDTNGFEINNYSWSNLESMSLALDSNNYPVVAWSEENEYEVPVGSSNYIRSLDISVKRFDGTDWVNVGTGEPLDVVDTDEATSVSLDLDSNNNPVIAWSEQAIYVKQWNGSSWTQHGPFGTASFDLSLTTRQVAGADVTLLAWSEDNSLETRRLEGSTWTQLTRLQRYVQSSDDFLAIDASGQPVIGINHFISEDDYVLSVFGYVKQKWQPLGASLGNPAYSPSLALQADDTPVVSFVQDDGSGSKIFVRQWDSSAERWWFPVDSALDEDALPDSKPSLALNEFGRPVVVFWENGYDLYAYQWSEFNNWQQYGSGYIVQGVNDFGVADASVAVRSDDTPVIAYAIYDAAEARYVVKVVAWDESSSSWQTIGSRLNIGTERVSHPSLALDSSGNPVVAWQETVGTSSNIYVKRWNAATSTWDSLGTTLDRVKAGNAVRPSLVLRSDGQPVVAFEETYGTSQDIYVRRWTGTSWQFLRNSSASVAADVTSGSDAVTPHLSLRSDNVPVLTFEQGDNIYVRRFLSNTWRTVEGGIVDRNAANAASSPVVAVKTNKQPTVAWVEDDSSGTDVFVSSY
jgi:hypothetical protein